MFSSVLELASLSVPPVAAGGVVVAGSARYPETGGGSILRRTQLQSAIVVGRSRKRIIADLVGDVEIESRTRADEFDAR